MKDKAIAKITEEAMAIDDPVAFGIEEHLTEICTNDTVAKKILSESKSLKASCNKVWAEARKRRTGGKNCVFIPPAEVYAMVDKYYGLDEQAAPEKRPASQKVDVLDLI